MSISMALKGRVYGPESKASQGYLLRLEAIGLVIPTTAKWVFSRDVVVRVFDHDRVVRVFDREEES